MANSDPGTTELTIESGAIVALRLFDIAHSIDLPCIETLWSEHKGASIQRGRLRATPAKAVSFGVPPVLLDLGPCAHDIAGMTKATSVTARFYDFGAVAIALRVQVSGLTWTEYLARVEAIDRAVGPSVRNPIWQSLLQELLGVVAPALVRPSAAALEEDYLLAVVREFGEPLSATELQRRADLVALLSGEKRTLSDGAQKDLLRQTYSYYTDDLVVLTWDRAFIYEPREDSDVADVLEVANAQLLELRYYDELLDAELPHMYGRVEDARRMVSMVAARRFAYLARRLYTLVAEVTELTEKVDNALQVTEDVYLARIYTAALELYRVPKLAAAVDRKLAIIRDTYTALYEEASSSRAELLELAIIFLIVVELVVALLRV